MVFVSLVVACSMWVGSAPPHDQPPIPDQEPAPQAAPPPLFSTVPDIDEMGVPLNGRVFVFGADPGRLGRVTLRPEGDAWGDERELDHDAVWSDGAPIDAEAPGAMQLVVQNDWGGHEVSGYFAVNDLEDHQGPEVTGTPTVVFSTYADPCGQSCVRRALTAQVSVESAVDDFRVAAYEVTLGTLDGQSLITRRFRAGRGRLEQSFGLSGWSAAGAEALQVRVGVIDIAGHFASYPVVVAELPTLDEDDDQPADRDDPRDAAVERLAGLLDRAAAAGACACLAPRDGAGATGGLLALFGLWWFGGGRTRRNKR